MLSKIRENPAVGGTVGGIVLLTAGLLAWSAMTEKPARKIEQFWYFDLNTKKLFPGPTDQYLPIDAPSGPLENAAAAPDTKGKAGVLALVYTCGACGEGEQYIGWLEYHKELVPFEEGEDETAAQKRYSESHLMRAPDGDTWVLYDSDEGAVIRNTAHKKCGASKPKRCDPGA